METIKTHFEDLSNEILYEIFDFLDIYHVYEAFHALNIRFEDLLNYSNLPIHINTSFLSKSNFQRYLTQFLLPNIHRISSLHLWNSFMFDDIFSSSENSKKFIGLKTVVLDNVSSLNHLNYLESLPNLFSLIINQSNDTIMMDTNFYSIIYLPTLKYCKLSFKSYVSFELQSNPSNKLSTIEHLVINGEFDIDELPYLLSCIPHLRRLSIDYLSHSYYWTRTRTRTFSQMSNELTHISLRLKNIEFRLFELFLINYFQNIEVLQISTNDDDEYIDANKWEKLISSHLLNLRIFDIQHINPFRSRHNYLEYDNRMKQFMTSFWVNRQWYFACQYPEGVSYNLFYSIKPYRRRSYVLYGKQYIVRPLPNDYHSVHHVQISNRSAITNCSIFFPNVHELTISDDQYTPSDPFTTVLDRIVPFKQLNKINIHCKNFQFDTLVQILYFTPNCYQLILKSLLLDEAKISSIEHDPRFRTISKINKTTDLVIESICNFKQVKLLTKLCQQVQHLTIKVIQNEFGSIIKYLLSKSNKYTCHLTSLHIESTEDIYIEKLTNLLQSLKRSNEFAVEDIDYRLSYIWW